VQPWFLEGNLKEMTVEVTHKIADEQVQIWNGAAGRAWVDAQQLLDDLFRPFETLLVDAVFAGRADRVLDVGCGTGSTTLAVARRLGGKGRCVGIDISEPMLAVARARAQQERASATFIVGNAQTQAFESESFDMIISRFGVMFFEDSVEAFANLRRAASDKAGLRCITWRSAAENPFMTTAERAAAPLLPDLPARLPDAPGQFAFADPRRVSSILEQSGWAEIEIQPIDVACTLPEKELNSYVLRLGPVGRILQEADERTRMQVAETVRAAFDPYVRGTEVRFTAACWMVGARKQMAARSPIP
jgi:SAM-dependent methyltransferase